MGNSPVCGSVSWQGTDSTFKMDHLERIKGLFTKLWMEFKGRDIGRAFAIPRSGGTREGSSGNSERMDMGREWPSGSCSFP